MREPAVTKAKLFPIEVEKVIDGEKSTIIEYDLHPHELRHTAASLAIAQGANIKAVSAMLGHGRASITLWTDTETSTQPIRMRSPRRSKQCTA